MTISARILSVGTATPPQSYTQDEVLAWAQESDPRVRRLFRNSHIERRYLDLPEHVKGRPKSETPKELTGRHLKNALGTGPQAIEQALQPLGLAASELSFLVCMTSTGFLCPSLSAHLVRAMSLRENIQRLDIVGMGCNAAVNGMQAATGIARARPGEVGVLVCVEVCSAAYAMDDEVSTAVVNSLFGDGAAAVVIRADEGDGKGDAPAVVDFEPYIFTDAIDAMKYRYSGERLAFYLAKDIPFVIGRHSNIPVDRLLSRNHLQRGDIAHWLVHSGGKKVIDAICGRLELSEDDVRHTRSVLEEYGNVSSCSVLFSYSKLVSEGCARPGDVGLLMAMGPGTSIEAALLKW